MEGTGIGAGIGYLKDKAKDAEALAAQAHDPKSLQNLKDFLAARKIGPKTLSHGLMGLGAGVAVPAIPSIIRSLSSQE
jgi:hypothetical protein